MVSIFASIMSAAAAPDIIIPLLIFLVAVLYASVGHGGASGYLAVFSFFALSVSHTEIASTALVMNFLVAGSAARAFYKAGYFRWELFWPFIVASIPLSFAGGMVRLPFSAYAAILSFLLFLVALRMLWGGESIGRILPMRRAMWLQIVLGGGIGFISGMIGIGGGILLSPAVLFLGWATMKETAAISALFIVLNSASGIVGRLVGDNYSVSTLLLSSLAAALIGGQIGSRLGANKFSNALVMRVLGIVLLIASVKLMLLVI